jgi:hypothetical protein
MVNEKHINLIRMLHAKSSAGLLDWQESYQKDSFQTSFPRYSVIVKVLRGSNSSPDYVVQLVNEEGQIVEEISDNELITQIESDPFSSHASFQPFKIMGELHEYARRRALGADQALDDVLAQLQSMEE